MASASTDSSSNTTAISFTFPSLNHLISVKLDGSNYLSWVSQFLPVLRSNDLLGIVDGSEPCPCKFIVDSHGKDTLTIDPKFTLWTKKDQYLLSWLNATLSETILPTVFGLNTAKEVWDSMANRFAAHNRSRIAYLKRQLQNSQQGNKTCADYVQIAKGLANQLAAVGKPIEDDDLISYIIGGLSSAYTAFITSFSFATRDVSLSFNDFQSELLNYEALLENQTKSVPPEAGQFALFNQYQNRGSLGFNKKHRYGQNKYTPRTQHPSQHPSYSPRSQQPPRNDSTTNNNSRNFAANGRQATIFNRDPPVTNTHADGDSQVPSSSTPPLQLSSPTSSPVSEIPHHTNDLLAQAEPIHPQSQTNSSPLSSSPVPRQI
ncbi:hypothetical protein SADUNF_Sadunf05G0135700 [Salix dunnii]|uniref:Retrotransposon Copia-like N-terminal domain-containing protein n=1 Tax=Salix dunnii TaxID=1413687 RepID=A0A835K651_9ROSI|nr:hypothetical protein SADUNF_Sadunf05G0135700 [Salix dunnii]